MCNSELQLSAMSSTLSLIPGNVFPHLALGVVSAFLVGYAMHYNRPSVKLGRVTTALNTAEETLAHAKGRCMRDYLALAETEIRFLGTKLTVSNLQARLLEARDLQGWKDYLQNIIAISRCLVMLEREVLLEAARRRRLTEDINETQAALERAIHHATASGYEV
ncbi:hypothetical protein MSAN_00233600 [Mycena sanguinolenta]|uniref:Uncharacterized protein n=1 Tax=Mycena sanguinolenta TaxID=230812 RepID=A0A8H6ZIS3_9AGAR|nr:hypothetical protein MSAN_00233600 [Mycena sanguinolenta]